MKKILTLFLIAIIGFSAWAIFTKERRQKIEEENLLSKTSDAPKVRRTMTIAGDDWLGYVVFRSTRFAQLLAREGIGVRFETVPDSSDRFLGLAEGKYQFAATTLDSYLALGGANAWPGAIVWTIDESNGGDAIISVPPIQTLDDLDKAKGSFTKASPSEFLLKSQASHFQLKNLVSRIYSMGRPTIEEAYKDLATKKVGFAVLWEPFKTKALKEIPGAKTLIDTRQVQGLIIDIFVASRKEIAESPEDVEKMAQAYFQTLHEWLASPATTAEAALRDIRSKDPQKTLPEAAEMLEGIHLTSLQENTGPNGWTNQQNPRLAISIGAVSRVLENLGTSVKLPSSEPRAILYSKATQSVRGVPPIAGAKPTLGNYRPLSTKEWDTLKDQVKGTLLDAPILFRPGQIEMPEETQAEILEAVPKLAHYPSYRIVVKAYSYGNSLEIDKRLSEERATEVKRFLVWECDVAEERVHAIGVGSEEALQRGPSENEQAYARRNRRARIILVGE